VRTEGLGKFMKSINLIGSRIPDLAACLVSRVPSAMSVLIGEVLYLSQA
jgi:hypothetical protein